MNVNTKLEVLSRQESQAIDGGERVPYIADQYRINGKGQIVPAGKIEQPVEMLAFMAIQ